MTKSAKFDLVKRYFDDGVWSIQRVRNAVGRWINEDEYEEITGEPYA